MKVWRPLGKVRTKRRRGQDRLLTPTAEIPPHEPPNTDKLANWPVWAGYGTSCRFFAETLSATHQKTDSSSGWSRPLASLKHGPRRSKVSFRQPLHAPCQTGTRSPRIPRRILPSAFPGDKPYHARLRTDANPGGSL